MVAVEVAKQLTERAAAFHGQPARRFIGQK
jgi:hypothetical protein